jgi:hypothetical protein
VLSVRTEEEPSARTERRKERSVDASQTLPPISAARQRFTSTVGLKRSADRARKSSRAQRRRLIAIHSSLLECARTAMRGLRRRRIRSARGQRLLRLHGERLEQPFAHLFETGGMRRVYLRRRANIRNRLLIQTSCFNLGLLKAISQSGSARRVASKASSQHSALFSR